jgi:hypothetical protein
VTQQWILFAALAANAVPTIAELRAANVEATR